MGKVVKVPLYGVTGKSASVDTGATEGAVVGSNLRWPDGSVVTEEFLRAGGSGGSASSGPDTTDDLDEGGYHLYFTASRAQDAVGGVLADTDTIDFTYDATTHLIKADLKALPDVGGGSLVKVARDAYGRLAGTSTASTDDLAEGGAHLYFSKSRVASALLQGIGIELEVDGAGNTTISLAVEDGGVLLTDWAGVQLTDWADEELEDWTPAGSNVISAFGRTGTVVAMAGDYNTSQVTENASFLYFTAARVRATVLTGLAAGTNAVILATDSLMAALAKLQAQVSARQVVGQPVLAPIYTLATLPAASATTASTAAHVFCSDLVEGLGPVWSDGTTWRRFTDNTVAN
jgi:hypothetical protein